MSLTYTSSVSKPSQNVALRINLQVFNNTNQDQPLDFSQSGNLTVPINAKYCNVIKYSIPSGTIPLYEFPTTYNLTFGLSYLGNMITQNVTLLNRGNGNDISELDQLTTSFNACL